MRAFPRACTLKVGRLNCSIVLQPHLYCSVKLAIRHPHSTLDALQMASPTQPRSVAVITGAGGMGLAIARRVGPGRLLFLADFSESALEKSKALLEEEGHFVQTHTVDVSSVDSVTAFADAASKAGPVEIVVHTAGVSPAMAPAKKVLQVDLLGTAVVIDAFRSALAPGGSMVCVASMAGHMLSPPLVAESETHFATAPTATLLDHPSLQQGGLEQGGLAYMIAKRANHLRVQAAAPSFGQRGCRINSVSPGVIHTAMVQQELASHGGQVIKHLASTSAMGRFGTAGDIVNVVGFLLSAESSFITGADIVVDGGSIASQRWGGKRSAYDSGDYD